jgi:hypothetical protein
MHAVPFNIEIPDHALADLRRRLRDTRAAADAAEPGGRASTARGCAT